MHLSLRHRARFVFSPDADSVQDEERKAAEAEKAAEAAKQAKREREKVRLIADRLRSHCDRRRRRSCARPASS